MQSFSFITVNRIIIILSGCRFLRQICVYSFLCSDMNLVSDKHTKCYSDQARD